MKGPLPLIPTVDLRAPDAAAVDSALQQAGFLLVTGHGVNRSLRAEVRAAARRFFALPTEVKQRYAVRIGGRGWLAPGLESNGNADVFGSVDRPAEDMAGADNPPDLKESFAVGPATPTGDAAVDAVWFPPNVWPAEVPELQAAVSRYLQAMTAVSHELLELCAAALGVAPDTLSASAKRPTWTFNINRYPPLTEVGEPLPGQFRIGPHTDFGTVTVLDREPGAGGLQVDINGVGWVDAPYDPDALTVNIGDLLAHWTGLRWRSGRHRVLPPQAGAPHEELVSLVFFFELDHDALVTPLAPPTGRRGDLQPVVSAPFLRQRLDAISLG
ncbi:MAG TPA: 2-oxoglutarate and iron-dependent oxygenase domain-containing protein [Pseudonocardia sp.]